MSGPKPNSRVVLIGSALALCAGWVVGHLAASGSPAEQAAAVQPGDAASPSTTDRAGAMPSQRGAVGTAGDGIERFQVPVSPSQPSRGPADAIVTIVEWCDLEGAACRSTQTLLSQVVARYGAQVRVVFRHFAHPARESQLAHQFARIAHTQAGKFWEAQGLLLASERAVTRADVERYAQQLGLNIEAVRRSLDARDQTGYIAADRLFAQMFGVEEAPALFVNGRRLGREASLPEMQRVIDDEIARAGALVARGVARDQVYAELTKHGIWKRVGSRQN